MSIDNVKSSLWTENVPRTLTDAEEDDFRDRITATATALFIEAGPSAVTMRAIATRIGCSRMTPYRYFEDKADIMAAVRMSGFDRLAAHLGTNDASAEPVTRVADLARAYVVFAATEPELYGLMFAVQQAEVGLNPSLDEAVDRSRAGVLAAAEAAVTSGELRGDPVRLALMFWAGLHGLVELHLHRQIRLRDDLPALAETMVSTLLDGCRAD